MKMDTNDKFVRSESSDFYTKNILENYKVQQITVNSTIQILLRFSNNI